LYCVLSSFGYCDAYFLGRTQKRKTVTTRFFKPITEITFIEGTPTQTKRREEIVRTEIDENILELPAGVLEPFAKNCDTIITIDNVEEVMPDGLPVFTLFFVSLSYLLTDWRRTARSIVLQIFFSSFFKVYFLKLNNFFSRSASKIHGDELPLVFQNFC